MTNFVRICAACGKSKVNMCLLQFQSSGKSRCFFSRLGGFCHLLIMDFVMFSLLVLKRLFSFPRFGWQLMCKKMRFWRTEFLVFVIFGEFIVIYLELIEFYMLTSSRLYEMNDWIFVFFLSPYQESGFDGQVGLEKALRVCVHQFVLLGFFSQVQCLNFKEHNQEHAMKFYLLDSLACQEVFVRLLIVFHGLHQFSCSKKEI